MPNDQHQEATSISVWLGTTVVLFGILLFAQQANELLKQTVITPGSSAAMGANANCRPDELIEEDLSLEECRLLVSSVQIILASSPDWFRPAQLGLSMTGGIATVLSLIIGFGTINGNTRLQHLGPRCFAFLLLLDICGLVAAANTGPLLRAQYLWPLLMWIFIHLCMLMAAIQILKSPHDASQ